MSWYHYSDKTSEYYTNVPKKLDRAVNFARQSPEATGAELVKLINEHLAQDGSTYGIDIYADVAVVLSQKDDESKKIDLPLGTYHFCADNHHLPDRLVPFSIRQDKYIILADKIKPVVEEIQTFLKGEKKYKDLGFLYRKSLLLYGDPGEGKTALIRHIIQHEINRQAVIIWIKDALPSLDFIKHINNTLKDTLKIFIFEELTEVVKGHNADMQGLLNFLDGEMTLDKCLTLATTNYPEELPGNIVDRPSRFDKLIKVEAPIAKERAILLDHFLERPATKAEIEETEGMSTATLKEIGLLFHLQDKSVKDSVAYFKKNKALIKKSFEESKKMGL